MTPAFNHFWNEADDSFVSYPMLDELYHPGVIDFVEERLNIKLKNPVHFLARDADP
jgi:hypothetical protein